MADLHSALSGALIGRAHALGVRDGKRHRLLLVNVLAGIERRHKMLAMQVLRRGDQHRVDALVFEQVPVIQVGLGVRSKFLRVF